MRLMLFMLPCMLLLGGVFLTLFVWAMRHDQFEDLEGEKYRMLRDDDGDAMDA
ncbi:MAG TPA: cbb3-type cytochrome oxidase assembly protein CcoS [Oscillatoriaceae cyanobacterium]